MRAATTITIQYVYILGNNCSNRQTSINKLFLTTMAGLETVSVCVMGSPQVQSWCCIGKYSNRSRILTLREIFCFISTTCYAQFFLWRRSAGRLGFNASWPQQCQVSPRLRVAAEYVYCVVDWLATCSLVRQGGTVSFSDTSRRALSLSFSLLAVLAMD